MSRVRIGEVDLRTLAALAEFRNPGATHGDEGRGTSGCRCGPAPSCLPPPASSLAVLLLLLVHDLVVRLHHVVGAAGRGARRLAGLPLGRLPGAARLLRLRVEALPRLAEGARELLLRRADLVHVVALERLPGPLDAGVEPRLEVGGQLVRPLL